MKLHCLLAITAALSFAVPACAADYAGRWEISGRQFGMYPSFQPVTDGRLEIAEVVDPQIKFVAKIRKDMLAKIRP